MTEIITPSHVSEFLVSTRGWYLGRLWNSWVVETEGKIGSLQEMEPRTAMQACLRSTFPSLHHAFPVHCEPEYECRTYGTDVSSQNFGHIQGDKKNAILGDRRRKNSLVLNSVSVSLQWPHRIHCEVLHSRLIEGIGQSESCPHTAEKVFTSWLQGIWTQNLGHVHKVIIDHLETDMLMWLD